MDDRRSAPDALETREVRFAVVFDDYDTALRLFRDAFGLQQIEVFDRHGGRGVALRVPEATLELLDPKHAAIVDNTEAGGPTRGRSRIAVRVDDLEVAGAAAAAAGAVPVADPVRTPWGDRNRRYRTNDGFQVTLFQPPDGADAPPG